MTDRSNEKLLEGGNVSKVYKSENTVRREQKPNSKNIHALLKHLARKGYRYAPQYVGIDQEGREILSFIEGEAGNYPLKKYMWSDDVLQKIAQLLRLYHDAVSDFAFDASWEPLHNTPPHAEVLCHNDFAIYNIIFQDKKPAGIIDFDMAAPGPRLWDIAYTLYTCVPLSRFYLTETSEKLYYNSLQDASRVKNRIQLFFDFYGEALAEDLMEMVLLRLEGLCETITRKAGEGDLAFQKMIEEGHLEHYRNDLKFILAHRQDWV